MARRGDLQAPQDHRGNTFRLVAWMHAALASVFSGSAGQKSTAALTAANLIKHDAACGKHSPCDVASPARSSPTVSTTSSSSDSMTSSIWEAHQGFSLTTPRDPTWATKTCTTTSTMGHLMSGMDAPGMLSIWAVLLEKNRTFQVATAMLEPLVHAHQTAVKLLTEQQLRRLVEDVSTIAQLASGTFTHLLPIISMVVAEVAWRHHDPDLSMAPDTITAVIAAAKPWSSDPTIQAAIKLATETPLKELPVQPPARLWYPTQRRVRYDRGSSAEKVTVAEAAASGKQAEDRRAGPSQELIPAHYAAA